MGQSRAFVDWVAATIPNDDKSVPNAVAVAEDVLPVTRGTWTPTKARNGYKYADRTPDGIIAMTGRDDMGTHLILPGSAIAALQTRGISIDALLQPFVEKGANFARVDCAIDTIDAGLDVPALKAALDHNNAVTSARRWSLLTSGESGFCLYVGSRQSERFLRVYNKAAQVASMGEKPLADDWIRVEIELKATAAHTAAHMLYATSDPARVARSQITLFADFPTVRTWRHVMSGHIMAVGKSHRRLTGTRRWLLGVVASALAAEIHADPGFKFEFERSVRAALENLSKDSRVT